MTVTMRDAKKRFDELAEMALSHESSILITDANGAPLLTLKPAPKPVCVLRGRPVYRVEDWDDLGVPRT